MSTSARSTAALLVAGTHPAAWGIGIGTKNLTKPCDERRRPNQLLKKCPRGAGCVLLPVLAAQGHAAKGHTRKGISHDH